MPCPGRKLQGHTCIFQLTKRNASSSSGRPRQAHLSKSAGGVHATPGEPTGLAVGFSLYPQHTAAGAPGHYKISGKSLLTEAPPVSWSSILPVPTFHPFWLTRDLQPSLISSPNLRTGFLCPRRRAEAWNIMPWVPRAHRTASILAKRTIRPCLRGGYGLKPALSPPPPSLGAGGSTPTSVGDGSAGGAHGRA